LVGIHDATTPGMRRVGVIVLAKKQHGMLCESTCWYPLGRIKGILPAGKPVKLERRPSKRQLNSHAVVHEVSEHLCSCFGGGVASWIAAKQKRASVSIIGAKNRLREEIALPVVDPASAEERFRLADILRTNFDERYANNAHTIIESTYRDAFGTSPVVIIEADHKLPDMLTDFTACTRFVLLDRSSPSYDETVSCLLKQHANRQREVKVLVPPTGVEALGFIS
jgi:hypothetical protein